MYGMAIYMVSILNLNLKGKTAIVSASSRGIGRAIAYGLAREGANVTILARNKEQLYKTAKEISSATGSEVLPIIADVTKKEDIEIVVRKTIDTFGTVHILVNNSGGPPSGYFEDFSDSDWIKAFELLVLNPIRFIRLVLPYMKKQKWGRIINIVSVSVKEPIDNLILSNSLRSAVVGIAKTLSNLVAEYNITINNVAPGPTFTSRIKELIKAQVKQKGITEEEVKNAWTQKVAMKRFGKPEEIADMVVFLASERASFITGTTIQVDGGYVKSLL